ncbi:hypothetical protein GCM10010517_24600 [Streptosporangium fragile]|uniref:PASTA domain-containing protein n=1 Tax=Streptosporangium fragile TaxID=46186 RepID=A0ABN3VVP2_9ACTN
MSLEQELSEAMRGHVAGVRASSLMGTAIRRRHRARRLRFRVAGAALATAAVAGAVPAYLALNAGPPPAAGGPAAPAGGEARAGVVEQVKVPDVGKKSVAEARAALAGVGLTVTVGNGAPGGSSPLPEPDDDDLVVEQIPAAGQAVPKGSAVELFAVARPAATSSPEAGPEKVSMPQDLGDLGDGREFGGVEFTYLPGGLVWGEWSVKNGFGVASYSTSWKKPDLPAGHYSVQAVVYRGDAAVAVTERMKGYRGQGAEPIKVGGRTAYLVNAGEAVGTIEESGTPTLVWAVGKGLAVEVMMSPDYAGELGGEAPAELRKIAEGVVPAK